MSRKTLFQHGSFSFWTFTIETPKWGFALTPDYAKWVCLQRSSVNRMYKWTIFFRHRVFMIGWTTNKRKQL